VREKKKKQSKLANKLSEMAERWRLEEEEKGRRGAKGMEKKSEKTYTEGKGMTERSKKAGDLKKNNVK